MHLNNKAFSLVELMIIVAICGILASLFSTALGVGCVNTTERKESAERNLSSWASQMSLEGNGTCSGADSDADGYASCTFVNANGDLQGLECGYDLAFAPLGQNSGCKVALPKMGVRSY